MLIYVSSSFLARRQTFYNGSVHLLFVFLFVSFIYLLFQLEHSHYFSSFIQSCRAFSRKHIIWFVQSRKHRCMHAHACVALLFLVALTVGALPTGSLPLCATVVRQIRSEQRGGLRRERQSGCCPLLSGDKRARGETERDREKGESNQKRATEVEHNRHRANKP